MPHYTIIKHAYTCHPFRIPSHPIPNPKSHSHPNPKSHPKSHPKSQIPSQIPFKSILASSGRRRTKIPPFEPARRDELNGGIPILLRPLDVKIFNETSKYQSTKNGFVNISLNNLAPSGHREMNLLPFDSSCWAGSNGNVFNSYDLCITFNLFFNDKIFLIRIFHFLYLIYSLFIKT